MWQYWLHDLHPGQEEYLVQDFFMAQQIWMGLGEFALQEFKGRHIPQNGL